MVLSKKRSILNIEFMDRNGDNFFWPDQPDVQFVPEMELLYVLHHPPVPCSSRYFSLEEVKTIDSFVTHLT